MRPLKDAQLQLLSGYFADISKILAASTVLNFFVSNETAASVTVPTVMVGAVLTVMCLLFSLTLVR